MDASNMSFEAKIAMALGGSSWQSLQNSNTADPILAAGQTAHADEEYEEYEDNDDEDGDDGNGIPIVDGTADAGAAQEPEVDEALLKKRKKKLERFEKTIARDAGEAVETIDVASLTPIAQQVSWDQDPELLCCYNWQASTDGTNTIFVPGEPAKWQQPALPHHLERDSGFQYQDYNYARQPRNPYSPMFQALSVMNPNFTFHNVDILADRNNLRVLLEFAQGKANGPFRLNVHLVFNTLVIVRRESRWWKLSDGQSYGINFERDFTTTTDDMLDATSHYRAIRYKMGPLNVVCRFEADAYDDGMTNDNLTESEAAATTGNGAGPTTKPTFNYSAPIRVLQKGHIVPTAQMVELKTQAYHPESSALVQCQDQLWFGRTSLLFTAPYDRDTGRVQRVKKENAAERVARWEQAQQEALRKLVALLVRIRTVLVRERRPNRAVVLVREAKGGPLVLRTMEERSHAVDRDTREIFWPLRAQSFGGHRGRGGDRGRGSFHGSHGRGQGGPGGRGNFPPPFHGRGQYPPPPPYNNATRGRGQGQFYGNTSSGPTYHGDQRTDVGQGRGAGRAKHTARGQGAGYSY
ncbi:hypothetical protein COCSADRAFT_157765 [Bipolaris sorokiniana ND90Pr]|uniref:Uncharacterized protein n=1 Tax=Cochliobolus sativus (strain ND90Pr / ATCC 201652) TaxID=665912 RepID=M2TF46_COCSN|nr:uncharacterized protein COCSADRAFT_157765 [Bipolaris sorokiniana ND90Pr]EMD67372.1 hypothetical protein COCSADRAFT_157765 [Bipolaris sorokiniana ND90Pr]